MKLFLFGVTGGTGQALLAQALEHGHDVTALARRPEAVAAVPGLTVVKGDATDQETLARYLHNHDAVLSALGPGGRSLGPTSLYSESAQAILSAMRETGVKRLVAVTSGGVVDGGGPFWYRLIKPLFKNVYGDMKRMESAVRASELDWTLVRPGYLTDSGHTGRYRTTLDLGAPPGGWRISRADTADFMLRVLEQDLFVRQAIAITY